MKKWQYKLVVGACEEVEKQINQLALEDWEPAGFTQHGDGMACLLKKRRTLGAANLGQRSPWQRAA